MQCFRYKDDSGSQLLEFAVALPLLIVFVVGIFDFGNAFNLKQKLNNSVRDAARLGASLPTSDLSATPVPPSIDTIHTLVANYLNNAQVNDCGLANTAGQAVPNTSLTWQYVASGNGCPAGADLTLTVFRGYAFPTTINGNTVDVISTQVTISYPYKWQFNNVIKFLVPGANYAGVTQITTQAIIPNQE
jgi:Flp pilus assembly protein TadG